MKKLNNKGFTLTELIVVIALIGILGAAVSLSVSNIFRNQSRKFVSSYDSMLSRCKIDTLAGAPAGTKVDLWLESSDNRYHAALYEGGTDPVDEIVLENASASCSYESGGTSTTIDGTPLSLSFSRTTGALNETCSKVVIDSFTVTLVQTTGYHKVG